MNHSILSTSRPLYVTMGRFGMILSSLLMILTLCLPHLSTPYIQLWPWLSYLLTYGLLTVSALLLLMHSSHQKVNHALYQHTFESPLKTRGLSAWLLSFFLITFYSVLYWYPHLLQGLIELINPISYLIAKQAADSWFLYGYLYTVVVILFGIRMLIQYRHSRYHMFRTLFLINIQLSLAFVLPYWLKSMSFPDFYPSYFWPLKPDYLLPFDYIQNPQHGIRSAQWSGYSIGRFMLLWSMIMSIIATPVLTYLYGKRWYCSWVCGCGALAETLGDPWRHLSDTSQQAWKIERWSIHLTLLSILSFTVFLWINEVNQRTFLGNDGSALFWRSYGFIVVMVLSGVIGVGLYPLLGGRFWCRYFCPQAAILGLFQKFFSRFQITSNGDLCISCGQCSTYCEMGIDVRAYAQEGDVIIRASCVGCGVCADVCPRSVLKLENNRYKVHTSHS